MLQSLEKSVVELLPHSRRYARALLGNVDAADLLVQHTALSILNANLWWAPRKLVRPWMFHEMHQQLAQPSLQEQISSLTTTAIHALEPSEEGQIKPLLCRVDSVLANMDLVQKSVFLMIELESFQVDQIAKILGISIKQAHLSNASARKLLLQSNV